MTAGAPTTQSAPADVLSAGDAGGMPRRRAHGDVVEWAPTPSP